jgi:hypothetical protein
MVGRPNTVLQKEANVIKQKYIKPETAALNVKNKLSPALKMRRYKNSRANQCRDISARTLKDHQ